MLPSPVKLGLPYEAWRPAQVLALERIQNSSNRFILLQAPTGSGKSAVVAGLQALLDTRLLYTSTTKQLQDQMVSTFPYAKVIKGRDNYPAANFPHRWPTISASLCSKRNGHCRLCCTGEDTDPCVGPRRCPYETAKREALSAKLVITNIAYFLNEANHIGQFGIQTRKDGTIIRWPWVAHDEADLLEDALKGFFEVGFGSRWIRQLNLPAPPRKTVVETWIQWARDIAIPHISKRLTEVRDTDWGIVSIKEEQYLTRALAKLEFFVTDVSENPKGWIYQSENSTFKAIFVSRYAERNLWRHADRFLLMSATIISVDQLCRDLSIPRSDVEFIDADSTFEPHRRPIHYVPSVAMSHKNKMDGWISSVQALDRIITRHPKRNMLVHTVSADLAKYVLLHSKNKAQMVGYGNGRGREEALGKFIKEGGILVAQSMERGVDLPYDLARIVVVLKLPYPNLGDEQVSKRVYSAKDGGIWYQVKTIRSLVQMTGRAMRAADDWCICYIVDAQFEDLMRRRHGLIPKWWKEALIMPR